MTVSTLRTITLTQFDTEAGPFEWEPTQPNSDLDFSVDATTWLNDITDTIASATLKVKPSGSGEASIEDLAAQGGVVTARINSGNIAGRLYVYEMTFESISGRQFVISITQCNSATFSSNYLPAPPSYDFGTTIIWNSGVTSYGQEFINVAYVAASGTTKDDAFILTAVNNIIESGALNAGVKLPIIISGIVTVLNDTDRDKYLYPNEGSHIITSSSSGEIDAGVNNPVIVSAGQKLSLLTSDPTDKWTSG